MTLISKRYGKHADRSYSLKAAADKMVVDQAGAKTRTESA